MRNKGFIIFLTVLISLLCVYYLSFTVVSTQVKKHAQEFASRADGTVDFAKQDRYLDSIADETVYNLGVKKYTYREVQDYTLNLGLDLQGGMHVTLAISPVEIIKSMAVDPEEPAVNIAIEKAGKIQKETGDNFVNAFYEAFKEDNPNTKLADIFASVSNKDRNIDFNSTDEQVIEAIDKEVSDAIVRAEEILKKRLDRFGTTQPNIQRVAGTERIQIELPGVQNKERVRNIVSGVAKLEFWEVYEFGEISQGFNVVDQVLRAEQKDKGEVKEETEDLAALTESSADSTAVENATEDDSTVSSLEEELASEDSTDSLSQSATSPLAELLTIVPDSRNRNRAYMYVEIEDTSKVNAVLRKPEVKIAFPGDVQFAWSTEIAEFEDGSKQLELIALQLGRRKMPKLTGEAIENATQTLNERQAPAVSMSMNPEGARIWREMTGNNVNRRIAIVLDGFVLSAPNVTQEISGGQSSISGNFQIEEAADLANMLKAGALPAPVKIVEEAIIGPTLGKKAQNQGLISIFVGLGLVLVFVVMYYAKGGLVANLALIFNIFFVIGILAQLNAALTLPGIAGIVLTIGMAIDANVLIFERIREELRNGVPLLKAIDNGYSKAWSSIVDANVTTFIIGVVLYVIGTGPVKGFAITLIIGIISSFFSAVFISRVIIEKIANKHNEKSMTFSTPFSKNLFTNFSIDFLGKRKTAYIISAVVIVIGLGVVFTNGLNYGVDFTGGRSYVVAFEQPATPSELKTELMGKFEGNSTEVKLYDANNVVKVTTSYMIDDESLEADQKVEKTLIDGISEITGLTYKENAQQVDGESFTIMSSSKVASSIAEDIKNTSWESAILSLVLIFLYILVRFRRWQFSAGAVVALFHDTLMVLSAFAIAGLFGFKFEIDQVFVAAILTIIGYSINDTVVVFDRIRESLGMKSSKDLTTNVNLAINDTLSRTLMTSMTTLLVVIVLLVFGGEVLRGFSFALFIGILVGTYSSVFVATPVAVDLSKEDK
ncbi:protein translocase subunit SecDF [Marinigracilibium pacificum]|uniref:Multifunctional fusion protein n=1 Tax=Marinigracilibium pacificum TaxID=2729599 RepID=A0A848ISX2_9BACT|nr:protein translocase subunit SecDF [Marinigracilibium pacificum]NMM47427.1 protein translocase subunit SecDF [Marinigracilibium pacificum]